MKIDVFTHVQPERYRKAIYRHSDKFLTDKNVQDQASDSDGPFIENEDH